MARLEKISLSLTDLQVKYTDESFANLILKKIKQDGKSYKAAMQELQALR